MSRPVVEWQWLVLRKPEGETWKEVSMQREHAEALEFAQRILNRLQDPVRIEPVQALNGKRWIRYRIPASYTASEIS